ncbi:MAG: hypothetical protein EAZ99_08765 [Alphaproteobacteria bacterium]|nr:MAG: hypothetical protein EAZ99_08765 [Alphaproteobacteria bacterium]
MKGLLAAGAFAIAAIAPAAVTAACFTQREWSAMEVALLDREMEVAALSCRTVAGVDFIQELNQVRARHRIREFTAVLQGYYNRSFGAQGRTRFDRFMTVSSNDFSMRSFASANFCGDMLTLFKAVSAAEPGTVTKLATDRARELQTMTGEVCTAPTAQRAPTTARTP